MNTRVALRGALMVVVLILVAGGKGGCGSDTAPPPAAPQVQGRPLSAVYSVHWTGARAHKQDITITVAHSHARPKVVHVMAREGGFTGHVDLLKGEFIRVTATQLESGGLYLDLTAGNGQILLDTPKQREDPGSITSYYERPAPNQAQARST